MTVAVGAGIFYDLNAVGMGWKMSNSNEKVLAEFTANRYEIQWQLGLESTECISSLWPS